MKKIVNNLPNGIVAIYPATTKDLAYASFGITFNSHHVAKYLGMYLTPHSRFASDIFFVEVSEDKLTLTLRVIEATSDDEKVVFDSIKLGVYQYNPAYDELLIVEENIAGYYHFTTEASVNEMRQKAVEGIQNCSLFFDYMANIMLNNAAYSRLVEKGLIEFNTTTLFDLYLCKVNKAFGLLLDNNMEKEIKSLFVNGLPFDSFGYDINKKTISIAKKIEAKKSSSIVTASKLLTKFEYNDLEALSKVAEHYSFAEEEFYNLLSEIDVNLAEFNNYLVKSAFVTTNMEYVDSCYSNDNSMLRSVVAFLTTFKDYLNTKEPEDEVYPEDLKKAHHDAANLYARKQEEERVKNQTDVFKQKVNEYRDLCWETEDGYKFIVPETPADLIAEGRKMHHCVGGYIDYVVRGRCKIMFLRKDDMPYMTIEVKDNQVWQCKKFANELPNEDDTVLIKNWATRNNLEVKNY